METTKNTLGGAPKGNQNAAKPKIITEAIRKHLIQNPENADKIVTVLMEKALAGDMAAIKELLDRLEGKPAQSVQQDTNISGDVKVYGWQSNVKS
jgi:hypothetical protein